MNFITQKIDKNEADSRLDKWAMRKFKNLAFTEIARFIRKGDIKLNGSKAQISAKLSVGDVVSYSKFLNKIDQSDQIQSTKASKDALQLVELIKSLIIFEDNDVLAINKPAGLAVQSGTNIRKCVADGIRHMNSEYRIVHRLDKYTSGVLVVAKNLKAAKSIGKCLRERQCLKSYIAICTGKFSKKTGEIHYPLLQTIVRGQEKMVRNREGLDSRTKYHVAKQGKNFSLVELNPITGRKHQLRAHLSILNCPIVGDMKYGGKNYDHMMLHAKYMNFSIDEEVYSIQADPPQYFQQMLDDI